MQTLKPSQKRAMRKICLPLSEAGLTKAHQKQLSGLTEIFYWDGSRKAVVCEVLGSSGFKKVVSVPTPRVWTKVKVSDDDESEDDQEHPNPYQSPANNAEVDLDDPMTDEDDEDLPDLAEVVSGKYQPTAQAASSSTATGTPESSADESVASAGPSSASSESQYAIDSEGHDAALATTIDEWQRRVHLLFKTETIANPHVDFFQICCDASRAKSFDFRLATMVVDRMLSACSSRREQGRAKARVPDDVPGCWTADDDSLLMKSDDPEDWEWVEKKHGGEACDRRFDFLETWERVPPAQNVM